MASVGTGDSIVSPPPVLFLKSATALMQADPSTPPAHVLEQFTKSDLVFGRVVVPVPNQNKAPKRGKLGFEYMEHSYIGDSIKLTLADGEPVAASSHRFRLPNGLNLTYGQINALAGDFYGTDRPISDGRDDQDYSARFLAAYDTLANGSPRQPGEANNILAVLQAEIDAVNNALMHHQDPSVAYSTLPDVTLKLEEITSDRSGIPSYVGLAQINWDHFGIDARIAYNTGHAIAIQRAIDGDLEGAYALNAFADHFLQDSFSSGHLRTPRRHLHEPPDITADACAKFMHDEDCAIGLRVKNAAGETWECYGDKRALDKEAAENLKRCVAAVQWSAGEIYTAYSTRGAPSPPDYAAWRMAPTLGSARSTSQALAKLFTFDSERRRDIKRRRVWEFTTDWWFWSTALECKTSGDCNNPIVLSSVRTAVRWSGISAVSPRIWSMGVFYQMPSGAIVQSVHSGAQWTRAHDPPIFDAVPFTPLASIIWEGGKQVRVYYLDRKYTLQEYCYSEGWGWFVGEIGEMNIRTSADTRIGAIQYVDRDGFHIRVYCQGAGSRAILELCNDGDWYKCSLDLPDALDGTSIAAVAYNWSSQPHIHVYYQAEDLSLREHCHNNSGWYPGEWSPGKVPGGNPINVVAFVPSGGNPQLQVYWRDFPDEIVVSKHIGHWRPATKVIGGIGPGFQFALLQWEQGKYTRLYYQNHTNLVLEHCSDDGGETWFQGCGVSGKWPGSLDRSELI